MMDAKTIKRCAIAWLFCALFMVDGSRFLRGQETGIPHTTDESLTTNDTRVNNESGMPDWFDADAVFSDKDWILFVKTEPQTDEASAESALEEDSIEAVRQQLTNWLNIDNVNEIVIDRDVVKGLLKDPAHWVIRPERSADAENKDSKEQILYRGYAEFHLGSEFQNSVLGRDQQIRLTQRRLAQSGLLGGSLLALLAVAFGYFKMETATRGYYSRRLQTGSLVIAAIVVVITYLVGQQL